MYEPKPGDRVKISRYQHGRLQTVSTMKIVEVSQYGYDAHCDDGSRGFYATSASFASGQRGWTQTIELLGTAS